MPAPQAIPHEVVEVKRLWGDPWEEETQLRLAERTVLVGADGHTGEDLRAFVRPYSPRHKYPGEADWTVPAEPLSMRGWWVRVRRPGEDGEILWQGRFLVDRRRVLRSSSGLRGLQTIIAAGPLEILKRVTVSSSFWYNAATEGHDELGWVPSVNRRGAGGRLRGNRGPEVTGYPYAFGAPSDAFEDEGVWTFRQFLDSLLFFHVEQTGGPTWGLTGAVEALDAHTEVVGLQPSQSALAIVRRLIRSEHGLGWVPVPTVVGWDLRVFALSRDGATFGTATLPANTDRMTVSPTTETDVLFSEAETSALQTVDELRVMGERCESCFTVGASQKQNAWTAAMESTFKAGSTKGGTPTPADHDLARGDDGLRLVYEGFLAADGFDWNLGLAAPSLDEEGYLEGTNATRQSAILETLPRLPLLEGGDYTGATPDESDAREEFIPPLAVGYVSAARGYVVLDKAGMADLAEADSLKLLGANVSILENAFGVRIDFDRNHIHAKGHWSAGSPAASCIDPETEGIDYDDTEFTIAAKTDWRLACYAWPDEPLGDGSKVAVEVAGAHFRYLAGGTLVGVKSDGTQKTAPSAGMVLRNDNESLHPVMAGAMERHLQDRFAAKITYDGHVPDTDWVGRILDIGPGEGDITGKWGVVTAVWYDFVRGRSGLFVGWAG